MRHATAKPRSRTSWAKLRNYAITQLRRPIALLPFPRGYCTTSRTCIETSKSRKYDMHVAWRHAVSVLVRYSSRTGQVLAKTLIALCLHQILQANYLVFVTSRANSEFVVC